MDEVEDEEYFDDFEENDYMEVEKEDFQDFGGGDTFGLDTEEEEEEDYIQSLLPLSSVQPSMVKGIIISHDHVLLRPKQARKLLATLVRNSAQRLTHSLTDRSKV